MADSFQEKTEQPTPKRLEEARKKGDVAKSMEVNSAFSLLFGLGLLYATGQLFFKQFMYIFGAIFNGGYLTELRIEDVPYYLILGFNTVGWVVLLFMGGILVVGIVASILQVGFMFTLEPIIPKFNKLNPLKGVKKIIFSKRSLEELIKNIIKLILIIFIAYKSISDYKQEFLPLMDQSVYQIMIFTVTAGLKISFKIALVFLIIGAADYAFQKYEYIRNLKMTKQEVKDEMKNAEGDPQVKSRIRSIQFQMARQRMMQEVPKADVVITNPTHFAVALKYEVGKMGAPKVIAKGQNHLALKIREIAIENGIPIVEDPPLARALYKSVDIDQEVPVQFFQAVAEVLAYVYKLNKKKLN